METGCKMCPRQAHAQKPGYCHAVLSVQGWKGINIKHRNVLSYINENISYFTKLSHENSNYRNDTRQLVSVIIGISRSGTEHLLTDILVLREETKIVVKTTNNSGDGNKDILYVPKWQSF